MIYKVNNRLQQFLCNWEFKRKYKKAQKLNRHDRRMLGKINGIGTIPKLK